MSEYSFYPVIDLPATGRRIQQLREKAGVTVRELQTYFGFEYPQAIYKWQHGECLPSVDNLLALSRVLRVPMEDLLVCDDREVSYFWTARPAIAGRMHNGEKAVGLWEYIQVDRNNVDHLKSMQRNDPLPIEKGTGKAMFQAVFQYPLCVFFGSLLRRDETR